MTAQIQALTNTVATLSTAIAAAAKENGGGGRRRWRKRAHVQIHMQHGSVLLLVWPSSYRRQPHQRNMHQKTRRPQRPRDRQPPVRREQLLAGTQQSQVLSARPSKVQRQTRQQMTGTGAGWSRRKRNKHGLIIKLLLYFIRHSPATLPGRRAGTHQQRQRHNRPRKIHQKGSPRRVHTLHCWGKRRHIQHRHPNCPPNGQQAQPWASLRTTFVNRQRRFTSCPPSKPILSSAHQSLPKQDI